MKYAIAILACLSLVACAGLGKPQPEIANYDFGLTPPSPAASWPASLAPADIEAPVVGLEGRAIRYRLEYREPARVYAYTLSRWTAPPQELLTRRLRQAAGSHAMATPCSMQATLETFDHVYQSADTSHGLIRMQVEIVDLKRRAVIARNTFSHTRPAPTQNARGGVAALSLAADAALQDIVNWAATVSAEGKLRACAGQGGPE